MMSFHPGPSQTRGRTFAGWPLLLLVLCACTTLPPQVAPPLPLDMPGAWSGAPASNAAATPLAQWWQRFDDPLLTELVIEALRHE